MKRHLTQHRILLILLCIVTFEFSCRQSPLTYKKHDGYTQGTTFHITYQSPQSHELDDQIDGILQTVNGSMSIYNPKSTLYAINNQEAKIKAEAILINCLLLAKEVHEKTDGAFDVTAGILVNAWGFGKDKTRILPENKVIDSIMQFVGFSLITIDSKHISKAHPSVSIDLNGIAKGYTVDLVADFFDAQKINNYLVEIGGEIRTKGVNPEGKPWRIGIDKPEDGHHAPGSKLQAILTLSDGALATSGNYRKYYEREGKKYAHTINPKTGYPVQHTLLSATVITERCAKADAYATACMVMGTEKSIKLLEENQEINGYLVWTDEDGVYQSYLSPALSEKIETINHLAY